MQSSGPDTIALDPPTSTNTVGEDHLVTATVEDEFGNPIVGEAVHFAVTGAGTPDPASGDVDTDAAGEADFTFTNEAPGTNTITACVDADAGLDCDAGELSTTATKTWEAGPPFAITLEPATDTNPVGAAHLLTATVADEFGNPLAGEDVHFDVTGTATPVPATGNDETDAAGQATFTFTNANAGTNTVTACVDADAGSDCDGGELSDTATKAWEVRVADSIALTPPTETNDVGTDHVVTATVLDQFGDPLAGADVHFAVSGGGTPDPASGEGLTNAAGQATFTFTNDTEATNTITGCIDDDPANNACDAGELTATATKTWEELECPGFEGDPRNQVVGTSGPNDLSGTSGDDIICGLGGNDILRGMGGNDLLLGGAGADEAIGGGGADEAQGAGGTDELNGGGGNDLLLGQGSNDVLLGGAGADEAQGGAGADTARGGDGRDELRGGDGADDLFGQAGNDSLFGQAGNDLLNGGGGNDHCNGGGGNNTFTSC